MTIYLSCRECKGSAFIRNSRENKHEDIVSQNNKTKQNKTKSTFQNVNCKAEDIYPCSWPRNIYVVYAIPAEMKEIWAASRRESWEEMSKYARDCMNNSVRDVGHLQDDTRSVWTLSLNRSSFISYFFQFHFVHRSTNTGTGLLNGPPYRSKIVNIYTSDKVSIRTGRK